MAEQNDAIISIRPVFAEAIMCGSKTIELRRRIPSVGPGMRLWIYATRPVGAVIGLAVVERIVRDTPEQIWNKYGEQTGIGLNDFETYFDGAVEAIAIFLVDIRRGNPIDIDILRTLREGFHPPQVLARLTQSEARSLRRLSKFG